MNELVVRGIPGEDFEALEARAQRHGHTCEDEVRQLIHRAAQEEQLVTQLDRATARVQAQLRRVEPLMRRPARSHSHRHKPTPGGDVHH